MKERNSKRFLNNITPYHGRSGASEDSFHLFFSENINIDFKLESLRVENFGFFTLVLLCINICTLILGTYLLGRYVFLKFTCNESW